jgi:hypothetical protein
MIEQDNEPEDGDAPDTEGGEKPEKVVDRPNVGVVTPDDYPDMRKGSCSATARDAKAPGPFPARAPLRDDCSSAPLESAPVGP